MKIALSLFNGISGLHLALDRAVIEVDQVYYSEIDKYANKVTEHHYPNDIALGDVTKWEDWDIDWSSVDLVGAGFPCQAWSVAGKQLGDKDERGMLFWTTLEIIAHVLKHNPSAKFLMENVKMKKDFEQYITHHTEQALGHVEKILINSALVSAQNRNRYYWTNFKVEQPEDKGILLRDIIEDYSNENHEVNTERKIKKVCNVNPSGRGMNGNVYHIDGLSPTLTTNKGEGIKITGVNKEFDINGGGQGNRVYSINGKSPSLLASSGGKAGCGSHLITDGRIVGRYLVDGKRQDHKIKVAGLKTQRLEVRNDGKTNTLSTVQKDNVVVYEDMQYRKLTPVECERLQTIPDGWTACVSNTQRYKSIGNGWTIDVIAHILSFIK